MTITSQSGQRMLSYLPAYYNNSNVMNNILDVQGNELDSLYNTLTNILCQFFVSTAGSNLKDWEAELGLTIAENAPLTERRERIISKLRGTGTATLKVLKEVAESYHNGTVEVLEDYGEYKVIVEFADTMGVPSNIGNIQSALRSVVPAHLIISFIYHYLIWSEFDALQLTWQLIDDQNLHWEEWEVYANA